MREAKDFWSRVDDDSLSSGRLRDDLEDDLDLRRRFYSNPATAVPGWMMPRFRDVKKTKTKQSICNTYVRTST